MKLATILLLLVAAPCMAEPPADDNLWGVLMASACVYQDPLHVGNTAYGKSIASTQGFPGWEQFGRRPVSQCLSARQWIPKPLCARVLATVFAVPNSGPELKRLHVEYAKEWDELKPIFGLLFLATAPDSFQCPASLSELKRFIESHHQ